MVRKVCTNGFLVGSLACVALASVLTTACSRRTFASEAETYVDATTRAAVELFHQLMEQGKPTAAGLDSYRDAIARTEDFLQRHSREAERKEYRALQEWVASHQNFADLCLQILDADDRAAVDQKGLVEQLNRLMRQGAEVRALLKRAASPA